MKIRPELYNEHELWKAVVVLSVIDALRPLSDRSELEKKNVKRDIRYILNDPDFNFVCGMANLDHNSIRQSFRKTLSKRIN